MSSDAPVLFGAAGGMTMLAHFYLSKNALFSLIQFRVLDAYRPIAGSGAIAGHSAAYMDGLDNVSLSTVVPQSPQTVGFILNVADPNSTAVVPAPGAVVTPMPAVTLGIGATLHTIDAAALPTSPDASTGAYPIPARNSVPIIGAQLALSMGVAANGDPILNAVMYQPPAGIDPTGPIWSTIASFAALSIPLPMGSALSGIIGPTARILNTGLAPTADGQGFAIRLEADDPQLPSVAARMGAWQSFFAGQQPSQLGIREWAAEVPTTYLLQTVIDQFGQQMQSFDVEKLFTNYTPADGAWTWNQPALTLSKRGVFENACAGIDIQAVINVTVSLSVPQGNTLRVSMHLDVDKDDWDTFKCGFFSVINPIAGIITAFDHSELPWYAALGVSVLSRIGVPLFILGLAFTNNAPLISIALKQVQDTLAKSGTALVRTGDTDCYIDLPLSLGALGTAAWLTLQEVAGVQDRLVIRGDYRPPNFAETLIFSGTLLQGFDFWRKPKCAAPALSQYSTTARIEFSLHDPAGKTVTKPVLSMKCGIDLPSGDTRCWRIVDDPAGVYNRTETLIHWTGAGVPGVFEIVVPNPPAAFAAAPYPLHLQVYTSYGVRQFDIPAPPPVPKLPSTQQEIIAEAVQRISECNAISSLIARIKALQVLWLPDPPPIFEPAQHWQIEVGGLTRGDWLHAWDAERGTPLAEVNAWAGNVAELSLIIDRAPVRTVQVTLNEQSLLSTDEYRRRSAEVAADSEGAPTPVFIQQTQLIKLAEFAVPIRAEGLDLQLSRDNLAILVWDASEAWRIETRPRALNEHSMTQVDSAAVRRSSLPARDMRMSHQLHNGRLMSRLFAPSGVEIGRFHVRPWFDGGGTAGRFFARLSDGRDRVVLYGRCAPVIAYPQLGDVK
jgi:hypothetical protein